MRSPALPKSLGCVSRAPGPSGPTPEAPVDPEGVGL